MRWVQIEGTALRTSRLGLGTSTLSHLMSSASRQRLLESAWSHGIRYFDTAPLYGHELAEREIGRFLTHRRHETVVATKFGLIPSRTLSNTPSLMYVHKISANALRRTGVRFLDFVPRRDYSAASALEQVHRSLKALRTDYIDILYLHEPTLEQVEDPEGLAKVLADLQRDGKVRYVGVSGITENCAAINDRCQQLGQVWQMDVSGAADPAQVANFLKGRPVQVTCGHFRNASLPKESSAINPAQNPFARAIELNPSGVILFSTRRIEHLHNTAAMINALESDVRSRVV